MIPERQDTDEMSPIIAPAEQEKLFSPQGREGQSKQRLADSPRRDGLTDQGDQGGLDFTGQSIGGESCTDNPGGLRRVPLKESAEY